MEDKFFNTGASGETFQIQITISISVLMKWSQNVTFLEDRTEAGRSEFKGSLVCRVSSRIAMAIQRNPVSTTPLPQGLVDRPGLR